MIGTTISGSPIVSVTPAVIISNSATQDTVVSSPSEPIENWLTSIKLRKYSNQFVNDLEIVTVSDLEPLLQCKTVEELFETIKGGGVKMKKIDASILFSKLPKLLSLHIE